MTTKMTRAEALAEAQKRWGNAGYAVHAPYEVHAGIRARSEAYEVGRTEDYGERGEEGCRWMAEGCGDSWEAAFRDADRRSPLDPRD